MKTELQLLASHSPSIQMSKRTNKSWRNSQPLKPAKLAELATIYAKLDSLPYLQWPAQRGVVHTLLTWSSGCILPRLTGQGMAGYQEYRLQPRLMADMARLLNMQKWSPFMQCLDWYNILLTLPLSLLQTLISFNKNSLTKHQINL